MVSIDAVQPHFPALHSHHGVANASRSFATLATVAGALGGRSSCNGRHRHCVCIRQLPLLGQAPPAAIPLQHVGVRQTPCLLLILRAGHPYFCRIRWVLVQRSLRQALRSSSDTRLRVRPASACAPRRCIAAWRGEGPGSHPREEEGVALIHHLDIPRLLHALRCDSNYKARDRHFSHDVERPEFSWVDTVEDLRALCGYLHYCEARAATPRVVRACVLARCRCGRPAVRALGKTVPNTFEFECSQHGHEPNWNRPTATFR